MALPCLAAVCGSTYSKDLGFYANVNDVTDVSSFFNVNDAIRLESLPRTIWAPDLPHVRSQVAWVQNMEQQMLQAFLTVFGTECRRPDAIFVDSGANDGLWTLLAAAFGCHVVAIEPQPLCHAALRHAVARNAFSADQIELHLLALSPTPRRYDMPTFWCKGTTQLHDGGTYRAIGGMSVRSPGRRRANFTAPMGGPGRLVNTSRLDSLVPRGRIVMWHLDTEGAELSCMLSASRLFEERRIDRVAFELMRESFFELGLWNGPRSEKGRATRWTVASKLARFREVFAEWRCTIVCTGERFRNFTEDGLELLWSRSCGKGKPRARDLVCEAPWTAALWGMVRGSF